MKCKVCGGKLCAWIRKQYDDRHGYPGYFDVYKCTDCGFGQTIPQLTRKKIAHVYEKYYPWKELEIDNLKAEAFVPPPEREIWRKGLGINCHYGVDKGSKVLDVGCGMGFSLLELRNMGCDPYGIDPDKNGERLAKKFGVRFFTGFMDQNPFPGTSFDVITASQVLEHTNQPVLFLKTLASRLKRGGRIILSFPNSDALYRKMLGRGWLHWHIPYHLNHFNRKSFEIACKKAGVEIRNLMTVTPNAWSGYQIVSLLGKRRRGVRDVFWDGTDASVRKVVGRLAEGLFDFTSINRIVDRLGHGESFVAELS